MNTDLLLQIIQLAAAIIKSKTSDNVDDKIDEATAIARIVAAGKEAYEIQAGQPLDESLLRFQKPIE